VIRANLEEWSAGSLLLVMAGVASRLYRGHHVMPRVPDL
jgi:hypothetical protein